MLVSYADEETEREILRRYHRGFDPHHLEAAGLSPVLDQEGRRLAGRLNCTGRHG